MDRPHARSAGQAIVEYLLIMACLVVLLAGLLYGPRLWQALRDVHAGLSERIAREGL
ncbi:MAG: hypothetical protein HY543_06145 [Deltaproteobacteria bacterium]|nr:hypothetical protein [Deltaproteobacteria bacterium]